MIRAAGIQNSGFRIQNGSLKPGRWTGLLLVLLAAGCAAPKPLFTDEDWVSHITTGRGCHERGDDRRAADAFERAQQRARAMDAADALAVAAVNRAVCLLRLDRAAEALEGIEEALADDRVSAERRMELQAAGARTELALGRLEEARSRAARVLQSRPPLLLQAQARLVLAGAALAVNDTAAAVQALEEGLSDGEWGRFPASIRAEYAAQRGRVAELDERHAEAAERQDEAAAFWKQAGRLPEMARALAAAGRSAQRAGDPAGAADRLYRAARSLWAQGLRAEAAGLLEEGVACAEPAGEEALARRMAELLVTFQRDLRRNHTGAESK